MNKVAIIPARGGSKRLARKNILPLAGKPMIAYPIAMALESGLFSQVVVSTEDAEIAEVAQEAGARVIMRPDDLATDAAGVVDVCLHVIDVLEAEGEKPDQFCCIYATAAFLKSDDFLASWRMLDAPPVCDFVLGVSPYEIHPYKALATSDEGYLVPQWPEENLKKSQEFPHFVASNGTLNWARTDAFRATHLFYGERLKGYEVSMERAHDIDTPRDYERAKLFAEFYLSSK